jgi:hypothetical protein
MENVGRDTKVSVLVECGVPDFGPILVRVNNRYFYSYGLLTLQGKLGFKIKFLLLIYSKSVGN